MQFTRKTSRSTRVVDEWVPPVGVELCFLEPAYDILWSRGRDDGLHASAILVHQGYVVQILQFKVFFETLHPNLDAGSNRRYAYALQNRGRHTSAQSAFREGLESTHNRERAQP
jgi:hypothetical protein